MSKPIILNWNTSQPLQPSYALDRASGLSVESRPEIGSVEMTNTGTRDFSDTIYIPIIDIDAVIKALQKAKKQAGSI